MNFAFPSLSFSAIEKEATLKSLPSFDFKSLISISVAIFPSIFNVFLFLLSISSSLYLLFLISL
ncbi:hypothetical protein, partial [Enterococcus faecium]|uniref:hypothetical protein n=1 Tax=Enterococcus faecium TaxID=1352 RepID=UPI001EFA0032